MQSASDQYPNDLRTVWHARIAEGIFFAEDRVFTEGSFFIHSTLFMPVCAFAMHSPEA